MYEPYIEILLRPLFGNSCNSESLKERKILEKDNWEKKTMVEMLTIPYRDRRLMDAGSSPGPLASVDRKR
jgi:hypothetical protein